MEVKYPRARPVNALVHDWYKLVRKLGLHVDVPAPVQVGKQSRQVSGILCAFERIEDDVWRLWIDPSPPQERNDDSSGE